MKSNLSVGWVASVGVVFSAAPTLLNDHRNIMGVLQAAVCLHNPLTLTLIRTVTLFYRPHRLPNSKELRDYTDRRIGL